MKLLNSLLFFLFFTLFLSQSAPAENKRSFNEWKASFKIRALKEGITEKTFDSAFKGIRPNKKIIKLDHHQPELKKTFLQYLKNRVPPRIKEGRKLLSIHKNLLEKISKKYHVPYEVIVALWGSESNFGKFTGGFSTIQALATLAYDGRRGEFFMSELIHALKIMQDNHIKVANMKGSWAGAMGQCQFMPSSFTSFAVDESGDGHIDIWHNIHDVFGSIANYLHKSGWNPDQPWGYQIKYNKSLERLAQLKTKKTLKDWKKAGITMIDGCELPDTNWVGLIVVPENSKMAFLLLGNAKVLLIWNRSIWFVLSIGLLSNGLQ